MIHLDYKIDPTEQQKIEVDKLVSATHTDLDYYLFCGDIIFRINTSNFDACWGWIPIIDFVFQLCSIVFNVEQGMYKELEFTESEATISFQRNGNIIEITASYSEDREKILLSELQQASRNFANKVFSDLASNYPQLLGNYAFKEKQNLLKEVISGR